MGNKIIDILIEGLVAFRRGHLSQDKAIGDMIEQLNELKLSEVHEGNKRPNPKDCDHVFHGGICTKCEIYDEIALNPRPESDTIEDEGQD